MRCDNCQFWKKIGDFDRGTWEAKAAGFRECTAIRFRHDIENEATKGLVKYPDDNTEPVVTVDFDEVGKRWLDAHVAAYQKEKAFVQDGSDYKGFLFTGPDFFCARYQVLTPFTENQNESA